MHALSAAGVKGELRERHRCLFVRNNLSLYLQAVGGMG